MPEKEPPVALSPSANLGDAAAELRQKPQQSQQTKEINENLEDTRFEVPTEQPPAVQEPAKSSAGNDAASGTIQEVSFVNASASDDAFAAQNEEKELETRLK